MSENTSRIRIFLADDHPVIRQGLASLLSGHSDLDVVGETGDSTDIVSRVSALTPDVVLLDVRMPGLDGIAVTRRLKHACPKTRVIILTTYSDDEYVMGALQAGAYAYLLKSASREVLTNSIRAVAAGERLLSPQLMSKVLQQVGDLARRAARHESGLTDDEFKVLAQMAEGASNDEIAAQLHWSEVTVKRRIRDILRKLRASNRTQAVAKAIRDGLI